MKRPNILFLHTDEQRWDTLGVNKNPLIHTPNLDALARRSVNFETCICQNPVCMPSRISLMSGQYCQTLGISEMAIPVPEETITIQKLLHRYGYYNALFGKLHYLPHSNRDHRRPHPAYAFDRMELSDEPGCYEDDYRAWVRRKCPEALCENPDAVSLGLPPATTLWQKALGFSDGIDHPKREIEEAYAFCSQDSLTHTAFVGEQTIEFLRSAPASPFFCFSGFYSPHSPLVAPQKYFDLYRTEDMPLPPLSASYLKKREETGNFSDDEIRLATRGYYAMISEVDDWIGKILAALKESGQADNTVIVFTSDHGEWLGEHLRYGKGYWAPDVISRVPCIFHVPKALGGRSGAQCDKIVECVDIVPTLLSLVGIPIPPEMHGDLLPVAEGLSPDTGDGFGLCENRGFKSLRMQNSRYVLAASGEEMFFDLEQDPFEYQNEIANPAYRSQIALARKNLLLRMLRIEGGKLREWCY